MESKIGVTMKNDNPSFAGHNLNKSNQNLCDGILRYVIIFHGDNFTISEFMAFYQFMMQKGIDGPQDMIDCQDGLNVDLPIIYESLKLEFDESRHNITKH